MKLGIGDQAEFTVDARLEWNASHIDVEPGERYSIEVTAITEEWKDAGVKSSLSKGWNPPARWIEPLIRLRARARKLPMYSLVGSINEDPATFFLIGAGTELVAPKAGQLQAFANDWKGRYGNNSGRLELLVRRGAAD